MCECVCCYSQNDICNKVQFRERLPTFRINSHNNSFSKAAKQIYIFTKANMKRPWLFQVNEVLSWIIIHNKTKRVLKTDIDTRTHAFETQNWCVDFNFIHIHSCWSPYSQAANRKRVYHHHHHHSVTHHLTNDSLHHQRNCHRNTLYFKKKNTRIWNCLEVLFNLLFHHQQKPHFILLLPSPILQLQFEIVSISNFSELKFHSQMT